MAMREDATGSDKIVPLHRDDTPEPARIGHASKAASNATHVFKFEGRSWRIFKRSKRPNANWYIHFERGGERVLRSLAASTLETAREEAKSYIAAFLQHRRDERSGLKPKAATVKFTPLAAIIGPAAGWPDLLGIVPDLPITANLATRRSYAWSLRWVLRFALDVTDAQVDALSADVLSKDTARQFWTKAMTKANTMPIQAERNGWLRNCLTFYANAVALFAPLPLDALRETFKLVLPADLAGWRNGRKVFLTENVSHDNSFHRPPDAVLRRTLVEWVKLARTPGYTIPGVTRHGPELSDLDRRNMFIAVGLALSCGLRAGEFEKARWRWFQVDGRRPLLAEGNVNVKNRSGSLRVRPVDPFWHILNFWVDRNGWRGAPDDYCLASRPAGAGTHPQLQYRTGGESDRVWWPAWLAGKWLRWLGWTTQKSNHALRDLTASYVTMKYGLERAKIFCRHGQQATTEAHYGSFVDEDVMDDPRRLAWFKWAK